MNENKQGLQSIKSLPDINNLEQMKEWAKTIISSELCPKRIVAPQDIITAVITGYELGVPPMQSINQIYSINGTPCIGIHIMSGLALSNGVFYEILKDNEPVYNYSDKNNNIFDQTYVTENSEQFQILPLPHDKLPSQFNLDETKIQVVRKLADRITTIKFTRQKLNLEGKFVTLSILHSFTYKQAEALELTKKDNWKKQLGTMLRSRCLGGGYKLIGADFLNGIREHSEVLESEGKQITVTEEGTVIEIDGQVVN